MANTGFTETIASCSKVAGNPGRTAARRGEDYGRIGEAYASAGDNDKAFANFAKSLELNPDDAYTCMQRANLYQQIGGTDMAITDCNKAVKLEPRGMSGVVALGVLGKLYNNRGKFDLVIAYLNIAIDAAPDIMKSNLYRDRGTGWANKGDSDRAQADHAKAIEYEMKGK